MSRLQAMTALALVAAIAAGAAPAQQPKRERLSGTIEAVHGGMVTAKSDNGARLTLDLSDKVIVYRSVKASLPDIKDGSFIGCGAIPQPDGTLRAVEVSIFPEAMRGIGEGHRPWRQPGSSMTNGTVGEAVKAANGGVLTVKYKGGEQKIVVPPGVPISRFEVVGVGAIKPGMHFSIYAAMKRPDGGYDVNLIELRP